MSVQRPSIEDTSGSGGDVVGAKAGELDAYQQDCVTILNAAIAFRDTTGALPNKQAAPQILEAVKGSLRSNLSAKTIFNRLRTLRFHLKKGGGIGGPLVRKLSSELWNGKINEEDEAEEEEEKEKETETATLTTLITVLEEEEGCENAAFVLDKIPFAVAKDLDQRLNKYFKKELKYLIEHQKFKMEILKLVKSAIESDSNW